MKIKFFNLTLMVFLPKKENNFPLAGIVALGLLLSAQLYFPPCSEAGFFKKSSQKEKPQEVLNLETSKYRIYYLAGAPEKKPDLGEGDFCELQYKVVYQDDWVPDSNRLIQTDFLDKDDYIVARDVAADNVFNAQGEYYGSQWIKSGQEKNIKKAEVHEVFQKNKIAEPGPVKVAKRKIPLKKEPFNRKEYFVGKNPKLKEIFERKVLTEIDIQEALTLTRPVGSASASSPDKEEKEKIEGETEEEVSLETSIT